MSGDYPAYSFSREEWYGLVKELRKSYEVWVPQSGPDDIWRLQMIKTDKLPDCSIRTYLPIKKLLLPPNEKVWLFRSGKYSSLMSSQSVAVFGVALCDLQAAWYLDRVFADDGHYQRRREKMLLVGLPCEPDESCRCNRNLMPISGDLFLDGTYAWGLSRLGNDLIQRLSKPKDSTALLPLPWPKTNSMKVTDCPQTLFDKSKKSDVLMDEANRCLACGACSAVCPTCYCFDLLDVVDSKGQVTRTRTWDNCFFPEHGKIAGGIDFRHGRFLRLRFRLEHKRLGFGELRGVNSCVGCGRCRSACPVDIDLDDIVIKLLRENS